MRAVICRELTGVGGLECVTDWPEPQAAAGEVVVDVKAAALNFLKGQVMKVSKGKANPGLIGEVLERKLRG